jgi:hypothetical protein
MIVINVECYAAYKADQRPLRFTLQDRVLEVMDIEDQWYSPSEYVYEAGSIEMRYASL